ncbi:M20 aminoacylase family protein [Roseococcus thiosulfatophilus]|uniref:M20 aminoacylase family protein n=1 Tax=Roseococcus thiosulfatophilus TaxID=35813 RepID=UPI001A8FC5E5|nr:M20 aminoacylase family protein [Roseococcus thiosulfatophilus]
MPVLNRIAEFHPEMTEWRQDFHRHPELGFEEVRTSGIVAAKLREFGCDEVLTGIAKTGVVGVIHGARGRTGRAIGLRADMDALPIHEATGLPHASTIPGKMHACGHDGHTAMLLGAAKYLAETRNFDGTVYVIFQPAEEGGGGGGVMVEEGLFTRFPMERVFGLHNWPGAPAGSFLWREGPVMAAVAGLEITVTGKGGHGALPFQTVDPIVASAAIIQALQTIVARNMDAADAGVITIGSIHAGEAGNVIPEVVKMTGTARWFLPEVGDLLERRFKEVVTGVAASLGATAEPVFRRAYPATINEGDSTRLAVRAAETIAGAAAVQHMDKPTMGAEDFAFMLEAKAGSYLMLGGGRGGNDASVHHPMYDFNDEILPIGASWWSTLAEQLLPRE